MRIESETAFIQKNTETKNRNVSGDPFDKRLALYMHRFQKAAFAEGSSVEPGQRWEQLKRGLREVRGTNGTIARAATKSLPVPREAAIRELPAVSFQGREDGTHPVERLVRAEKSAEVNPLEYWHRLKAAQKEAIAGKRGVEMPERQIGRGLHYRDEA